VLGLFEKIRTVRADVAGKESVCWDWNPIRDFV
jgi:hypothetical protein